MSPLLPLPVTPSPLRPLRRLSAGGVFVSALAVLLALSGCAAPTVNSTPSEAAALARLMAPASAASAAASAAPLRYTLNAGDEFDVKVPDAPQLEQTLRVRPDGKVSLPLIGTVHVQGRTPDDVQDELRERLAALAGQSAGREYLLHANDELEIKFPYHAALNEALRVRPDGKLQLQLVGTVQVEGRSPEDLRAELKQRYAKWLRNPELTVIVRTATSQSVRIAGGAGGGASGRAGLAGLQPVIIVRNAQATQVFVGGEVTRPGVLTWRPGLSLVQAVVESGGALPSGDRQQLAIVRRGGPDGPQVLRIGTLADPLAQPAQDVLLEPFDVVLLPKHRAATLADNLNLYVFNLVPLLRNSSFSFAYNLRNTNGN